MATSAPLVLALLAPPGASAQTETDLSVAWIGRLPKQPYVWDSRRPHVAGWPKPRQRVTWVAHVLNLGDRRLTGVRYRWLLDGHVVASGKATVQPGRLVRFNLRRPWRRVRQELTFEIDPDDAIAEREERNNRLLVHTDALAVGIWVERSFWEGIRPRLASLGTGTASFDDWMQLRMRQFNEMAALARYPDTPQGVLDRWRIDAIHVVPDGRLPVSPVGPEVRDWGATPSSYPTLYPDSKDRTIDMQWGFPASSLSFFSGRDVWALTNDSFLHELGHARYLIDVYAWDVSTPRDEIGISPAPPGGWRHETPEHGLMNTSWGYIDRYSAMALNRIAGRRATQGHYNEPSNIGVFLDDLPAENRLRLVTPDGRVYPHRRVEIYRASSERDEDWLEHSYRLSIDGIPDLELETDGDGAVLVGRNPFADEPPVIAVDRNNALAIVRLVDGATSRWGYLEARVLNLAYWRGHTAYAEHDVILDEVLCFGPGLGPHLVTPSHWALATGPEITFEWLSGLASGPLRLWWSVDGGEPQGVELPAAATSTTLAIEGGHVAWWLDYVRAGADPSCPRVRTTTYFFDVAVP